MASRQGDDDLVVSETHTVASLQSLWDRLIYGLRSRRVPAGQFVVRKDTLPADVFLLQNGRIKLGDIDARGNEKILHLLRPPAVLPFTFFSGSGEPSRWSYMSLTDCEVLVLPYERLHGLSTSDGELATALMGWFSQEVHELLVRLSSLENSNVREKIIAALRFLLAFHSQKIYDEWYRVDFPVSHQLLANMTGVRRESVTQQIGRLHHEGVVNTAEFATLDIFRTGVER